MGDDLPQPGREIGARRTLAAQSGKIEMRMSVDESRQNGDIAEIRISASRGSGLDGDDAFPSDGEYAIG